MERRTRFGRAEGLLALAAIGIVALSVATCSGPAAAPTAPQVPTAAAAQDGTLTAKGVVPVPYPNTGGGGGAGTPTKVDYPNTGAGTSPSPSPSPTPSASTSPSPSPSPTTPPLACLLMSASVNGGPAGPTDWSPGASVTSGVISATTAGCPLKSATYTVTLTSNVDMSAADMGPVTIAVIFGSTQVTLINGVKLTGLNITNAKFSATGTTAFDAAGAPYSNTYKLTSDSLIGTMSDALDTKTLQLIVTAPGSVAGNQITAVNWSASLGF